MQTAPQSLPSRRVPRASEPWSPGLRQSLAEKYTIPDKSVRSQLGDATRNGFARNSDRKKLTNNNYSKVSDRAI